MPRLCNNSENRKEAPKAIAPTTYRGNFRRTRANNNGTGPEKKSEFLQMIFDERSFLSTSFHLCCLVTRTTSVYFRFKVS